MAVACFMRWCASWARRRAGTGARLSELAPSARTPVHQGLDSFGRDGGKRCARCRCPPVRAAPTARVWARAGGRAGGGQADQLCAADGGQGRDARAHGQEEGRRGRRADQGREAPARGALAGVQGLVWGISGCAGAHGQEERTARAPGSREAPARGAPRACWRVGEAVWGWGGRVGPGVCRGREGSADHVGKAEPGSPHARTKSSPLAGGPAPRCARARRAAGRAAACWCWQQQYTTMETGCSAHPVISGRSKARTSSRGGCADVAAHTLGSPHALGKRVTSCSLSEPGPCLPWGAGRGRGGLEVG